MLFEFGLKEFPLLLARSFFCRSLRPIRFGIAGSGGRVGNLERHRPMPHDRFAPAVESILMSDFFVTRQLDGYAASFARFEGSDRFVIEVDGIYRTVTREFWRNLPIYQSDPSRPDVSATGTISD